MQQIAVFALPRQSCHAPRGVVVVTNIVAKGTRILEYAECVSAAFICHRVLKSGTTVTPGAIHHLNGAGHAMERARSAHAREQSSYQDHCYDRGRATPCGGGAATTNKMPGLKEITEYLQE